MIPLKLLIAIVALQLSLNAALAQNKTVDKIEKISNDLDKIFNKKPKTNRASKTTASNRTTEEASPVDNSVARAEKHGNGQQPGDLAPGAKAVDADHFYDFNMGAAVVQKVAAYGLIDMNGNFIVPYNKYKSILSFRVDAPVTNNGIFLIDNGQGGAIDAKGKMITASLPNSTWDYGSKDNQLIRCTSCNTSAIYLDVNGHKYTLKEPLADIVDGIGLYLDRSTYKTGYKNLRDEWIVRPMYDFAAPFSESMACVGKKNEFGQIKYGFIDKTGKEVIPLQFSKQPDNFLAGLARVTPADITEFHEAYIDKKGNIVQKLNTFYMFVYIGNGLFVRAYQYQDLMDSTGKMTMRDSYLKSLGVELNTSTEKAITLSSEKCTGNNGFNDGKVTFTRSFKQRNVSNMGYVDLKTKRIMEGAFTSAVSLHYYDPISKLAVATFNTTGKIDKTPLRQGYINEEGLFVIVKAETSKW